MIYEAVDTAGNKATATRIITVVDTTTTTITTTTVTTMACAACATDLLLGFKPADSGFRSLTHSSVLQTYAGSSIASIEE